MALTKVISKQVTYKQGSTGSVVRGLESKLQESVSVKDFGAVGDGVNDDTAEIQAAFSSGAKEVRFPTGTYKISNDLNLTSNMTVRCDANVVIDNSTAPSGSAAFNANGSVGADVALTANAAVGATSLTVLAGTETAFAAGDWVQVYSNTIYDPGWTVSPIGEAVQVASVASGVVNLNSPLAGGPYNTANVANVRKITFVENINIFGGKVVGSSVPTDINGAVQFGFAYNCHVEGMQARYCNGAAIELASSLFCSVKSVHIEDCLSTSSGYGVSFDDTSQDCTVVDSTFTRVRHAVTNAHTSTGVGLCRRITYQNLKCYNTINTGDAFDTHANAEDIQFNNCISYDSSSNGFNIECGSAMLNGCLAVRSASNGFVLVIGATIKPANFGVVGCYADTAGTYGFRSNIGSTVNSAVVERVSIVGCSSKGVQVGVALQGSVSCPLINSEVIGGVYSGSSANGAIFVGDYVQKFKIANVHAIVDSVNDSGIVVNGANTNYGTLDSNIVEYSVPGATGASSTACIRLTSCNNISLTGNVGIQPASAGGNGIRTTGVTSNIFVDSSNNMVACTNPGVGLAQATLVISAGVVTLPNGGQMIVPVDTEAAAPTDDLDTINNGVPGQIITVSTVDSARDVVMKDGTGNLRLAGDYTIPTVQSTITLINRAGVWWEMCRSTNG